MQAVLAHQPHHDLPEEVPSMNYTLDEIKDSVSLEEVLLEVGAEFETSSGSYGWRSEVPFFCFVHLNVNTAAASMNTLKGVWNCYSCGAGGSVIDAAMYYLDTKSVTEAAEWLEERFLS